MAIPPSGPLSFNRINQELGCAAPYATPNSSINSAAYRTLAGVPSGQIAMSCFYGKSPAPALEVRYVIVAGGGGGGRGTAGGGGAGGVRTNVCAPYGAADPIDPAAAQIPYCAGKIYIVSVGGGGGGAAASPGTGQAGGGGYSDISTTVPSFPSVIQYCSTGGGSGGSASGTRAGGTGGSGGGGAGQTVTPPNRGLGGGVNNVGVVYAVSVGGAGYPSTVSVAGGGGGGAAAAGGTGGAPGSPAGAGGSGICWNGFRAVGGGGAGSAGPSNPIAIGGSFGGGGGSGGGPATSIAGTGGSSYTGGGGGAAKGTAGGGQGGSGQVIIGYPGPPKANVPAPAASTINSPPMTYHVYQNTGYFCWI